MGERCCMVVPLCGRTIASMRVDMVNDRRCNTWSDERRSASHGACMKLQGLITTVRAAAGVQIRAHCDPGLLHESYAHERLKSSLAFPLPQA